MRVKSKRSDETQRPFVNRVLDEAAVAGEVSVMIEYASQVLAVVVVARDQVRWHRQRLKHYTKPLVLLHATMISEVAGRDHHVWTGPDAPLATALSWWAPSRPLPEEASLLTKQAAERADLRTMGRA